MVLWPVASVMEQDDHRERIYLDAVRSGPHASFASSVAAMLLVLADEIDPCHLRTPCDNGRHCRDTFFEIDSELD